MWSEGSLARLELTGKFSGGFSNGRTNTPAQDCCPQTRSCRIPNGVGNEKWRRMCCRLYVSGNIKQSPMCEMLYCWDHPTLRPAAMEAHLETRWIHLVLKQGIYSVFWGSQRDFLPPGSLLLCKNMQNPGAAGHISGCCENVFRRAFRSAPPSRSPW